MAVFGRKRRSTPTTDSDAGLLDQKLLDDFEAGRDADDAEDVSQTEAEAAEAESAGTQGPYDHAEVPGLQGRLDLGSLWLTAAPGMQVRLDMDEQTAEVTSVTAMLAQSALQLQAFAAPKSEGIWSEIRAEIAQSVTAQGGTAQEEAGPHGVELLTRIPARGPDGRAVHQQARFIGVDGPRWFLRAVITGPAAVDTAQRPPLLFVLATSVVVRGAEARAPRELLPLTLPQELLAGPETGELDAAAAPSPDLKDLRPFERGPEITEIR